MNRLHLNPLALLVCMFTGLGIAQTSDAQTSAGRFDFAIGEVAVTDNQGASRNVRRGTQVFSGETIRVGRGRAQVRFSDGSRVSLVEQTDFKIEDYQYEAADRRGNRSRSFFDLVRGGVRMLTGLIGKRSTDRWKMRTPVATIGVRGTYFFANIVDDVLLVSVSEQPTLAQQGVVVSNAFGSSVAGAGQSIQVVSGQAPSLSDLQANVGFLQPQDAQALLDDANELLDELGSLFETGEIRNGLELAIGNSTNLAGAFSADFFLNAVNFSLDNSLAPSVATGICCENDNVNLIRGSASVVDAQSGNGWSLFAWENGTYAVNFNPSGLDIPGFVSPFPAGTSVRTLAGPHQRLNFALGVPTTSLTSGSNVFVNFNNVIATLPVTTIDGSVLDPSGGVISSGTNVFYDSAAAQFVASPLNVQILGDVVAINGSSDVVPAFGTGYVFVNPSYLGSSAGTICSATCAATVIGSFIGNNISANGNPIPTGAAINVGVVDPAGTFQTAAILGVSGVLEGPPSDPTPEPPDPD